MQIDIKINNNSIVLSIPQITQPKIFVKTNLLTSSVRIDASSFILNNKKLNYSISLDEMEIDLNSSAIEYINYLPHEKALIIKFWNSECYCYYNIPEFLYGLFVIAESKGKYYHQFIQNKFESEIIPAEFTVDDLKNHIKNKQKQAKSIPFINNNFNIKILDLDFKTLSPKFRKEQMKSPYFPYKDYLTEILADFNLSVNLLKYHKDTLPESIKSEISKLYPNHQYTSIPIKRTKKSKQIIVPQYHLLTTHINGLTSVPEMEIKEAPANPKLKKGQVLMNQDEDGNLSVVRYRLAY